MFMYRVAAEQIESWRKSRLSPMMKELAISVIRRAAQGMHDQGLYRYLDYRKRGVDPNSTQWQAIEMTQEALRRDGSKLRKSICEIRSELERIEAERSAADEATREGRSYHVSSAEAHLAWKDEMRYKNSLIRPEARGSSRNSKSRTRSKKKRYVRRSYLDAMARHDEKIRARRRREAREKRDKR